MLFLSLFKTLHTCEVKVELKNGLVVNGRIDTVDQYHNIKLTNVTAEDPEKYPHLASVDELFIRGSVLRYISIPPEKVNLELLHESCRRSNPLTKP
jgi:U6 snRNA-associated Sm-like protein LSm2